MSKLKKVNINIKFENIDYSQINKYIRNDEIVFAPIVHAKWIDTEVGKEVYCSNCDGAIPFNCYGKISYIDYCPNCGAKMDREAKE